MSKVAKLPDAPGCWLFIGAPAKPNSEYSIFWHGGVGIRAHRASWEIHKGSIPDGLEVCHRCDNPACVNPEHLFVGTHHQNMLDCQAKGRYARTLGDANGSRKHPERLKRGRENPAAKLDEERVRQIRARLTAGVYQRDVAREFGVSQAVVNHINLRKTWRHVA